MKKLSYSTRKFIRKEKALIRREGLGVEEKNKRIQDLYQKFLKPLDSSQIQENNDKIVKQQTKKA